MPSLPSPSDVYGALVDRAGSASPELMDVIAQGAAYPYNPERFPADWRERLEQVERFIVGFSGGKDSIACFLYLLEMGIPRERIELWHHRIDPPDRPFMDWPCTEAYCREFAGAFGVRIYYSGKVTGFEGEMLRENAPTGPTFFETPSGDVRVVGGDSPKRSTRMKFPQVSPDLSVRWCSSYLKIECGQVGPAGDGAGVPTSYNPYKGPRFVAEGSEVTQAAGARFGSADGRPVLVSFGAE